MCHNFNQAKIDFSDYFSWVVEIRFHVSQFLRVSFHVGHLPTKLEWKYKCHSVKSTISLEFGG